MDESLAKGGLSAPEQAGELDEPRNIGRTKSETDFQLTTQQSQSQLSLNSDSQHNNHHHHHHRNVINNNNCTTAVNNNNLHLHQQNNQRDNEEWIMLNVGGQLFTTTRTTLCTPEPNSMLARMFSQPTRLFSSSTTTNSNHHSHDHHHNPNQGITPTISLKPSPKDVNGAYLIDRSPKYFEPILNYLRHGKLIIDHDVNVQGVLEEAKFYGIVSLLPMLELETERWFKKKHLDLMQSLYDQQLQYSNPHNYNQSVSCSGSIQCADGSGGCADGTHLQTMPPLTRQDVIRAIMSTSAATAELRFQGCNLAGANLSRLDLRHINFKYANLRNSNLKGANLSQSNLERADLFQSNLEGAQLTGANLAHANLENSNLRAITVLDPTNDRTKPKTSFEGANLKNTNFEGSQLAQVSMRVAILRGSNLQNCDLSKAILAGADLENCDLSGSDLNEANLRNANVKGAQFEYEVL